MIPRRWLRSAFMLSVLLAFVSFGTAAAQPIQANHAISATSTTDRSTLSFVSNVGQLDPSVRFEMRTSHKTLWFGSNRIILNLSALSDLAVMVSCANPNMQMTAAPVEIQSLLGLLFDHANSNPALEGLGQPLGTANLFTTADPLEWRANEAVYAGIVYHDLYPGVDLSFASQAGALTATYTLAAGVDPSIIAWHYLNADSLYMNTATGDLHIYTSDGGLLMSYAPVATQMRDGQQVRVNVSYQNTSDTGVRLAAALTGYDLALPLSISIRLN